MSNYDLYEEYIKNSIPVFEEWGEDEFMFCSNELCANCKISRFCTIRSKERNVPIVDLEEYEKIKKKNPEYLL